MADSQFFERPILNSPYDYPQQHWELDSTGQPTQLILPTRRGAEFITPIPKPRKQGGKDKQASMVFDEGLGLSSADQQYDHAAIINTVRQQVDRWRQLPNPHDWRVTPETARLLQHLRLQLRCPFIRFRQARPHPCAESAHECRPAHGRGLEEHRQGQRVRRLRRTRYRHP